MALHGDSDMPVVPWVLSARSAEALAGQAERLLAHVGADQALGVADVGWSLVSTRSMFEHRAVVVGADREHLMAGLAGLAAGEPGANVVVGRAEAVGKTVFVFPGQGSQWVGMGAQLLDTSKVFADHMHRCDKALGEHVEWSLIDVIRGVADAPGLDRVDVVQPALWAVMVSLAELWRSSGRRPRRGDRPFAGRDRRGVRGGRVVARRCRPGRGAAKPAAGAVVGRRRHGLPGVWAADEHTSCRRSGVID